MRISTINQRLKAVHQSLGWLLLISGAGYTTPLLACVVPGPTPSSASAPEPWLPPTPVMSPLALEVELNGTPTGLLASFVQTVEGDLATTRAELGQLGFNESVLPAGVCGLVWLSQLQDLSYRYDEAAQRLALTTAPELLKVNRLGRVDEPPHALAPVATGLVLNYSLVGSAERQNGSARFAEFNGGAHLEGRLFGDFGVFTSSLAASTASRTGANVVRLDTNWVWEDPQRLLAVKVGDLVSSALSWSRPLRMGGVQFARSFDLRPDLLTRPVPLLRGTAQAPSTLDVFLDGAKVYSEEIQPGPFEVSPGPPRTGAGLAEVVVRDVLGRESRLELPFYTSDALLAPGLIDFSVEVGFARRNFGFDSNNYHNGVLLTASGRYGVSDHLTLQAHGEGAADLQLLGGGAVFTLGPLALASVSASGSRSRSGTGANIDIGIEARHGSWSASLRAARTIGPYRDLISLTSEHGDALGDEHSQFAPPERLEQAQVSGELWHNSQLSISYARVRRGEDHARLATFNFSQQMGRANAYIRGWKDFVDSRANGVTLGLIVPLGPRLLSSGEVIYARDNYSGVLEVASLPTGEPGSLGWRARIAEGFLDERLVALTYLAPQGRVEIGFRQTGAHSAAFAQADGALVMADGNFFVSRQIDRAFAVADAGAPGVPVRFENRKAGKTGSSGKLLIPDLMAYQPNRIGFDASRLPLDRQVTTEEFVVVPRGAVGATVRLGAATVSNAALVSFVDGHGQPIKPGSRGAIEGAGETFVVGYDGEAFLSGLAAENTVMIDDGSNGTCLASLAFAPKAGDQVRLGPVQCRPVQIARPEANDGEEIASTTAETPRLPYLSLTLSE